MLRDSGDLQAAMMAIDSIDDGNFSRRGHARYLYLKGATRDEYSEIDRAIFYMKGAVREAAACGDDSLRHDATLYLSYLSNISGNTNLAIDYAFQALSLAERLNNRSWEGQAYLQLSGSYFAKGKIDSSDYYINKLIPILEYQREYDLPDMLNNIAVSHLRQGDASMARRCLRRSLSIKPNEHTYYLLAETYCLEGRPDSARTMWIKALDGKDLYLQSRISQAYARWLQSVGEFEKASEMLSRSNALKDSLDSRGLGEAAMTANNVYDRKALEDVQTRHRMFYGAICVVLVIVAISLWSFSRSKSKKAATLTRSASSLAVQMAEMESMMEQLRSEIETLRSQSEQHNRDACELGIMVERKSRQLRSLEEKYAGKESEMREMQSRVKAMESERNDLMQIGKQRYAELAAGGKATLWNKRDMQLFIDYYCLINPGFGIRLDREYSSLSPTLKMILILEDAGRDAVAVQVALGMSPGAYRTARSRINAHRKNRQ